MKYTKELLEPLAVESFTVSEVVRKLGKIATGSACRHVRQRLDFFEIDTSHFSQKRKAKLEASDILLRTLPRREHAKNLRKALLGNGIEFKCKVCGLGPEWNGQYLLLQVDHINGNGLDNRLDNLRFLCPNCHSQTKTFGSKNNK